MPDFNLFLKPEDNLFPLQKGMELYGDGPNADPDPSIKFVFEVAFGEQNVVFGLPLINTINEICRTVENIILEFD